MHYLCFVLVKIYTKIAYNATVVKKPRRGASGQKKTWIRDGPKGALESVEYRANYQ
jgi:hypothetical protein